MPDKKDNISALYNELKDKYAIESEDSFRQYLSNSDNREALRKDLESEYTVGSKYDFDQYLGFLTPEQHLLETSGDAPLKQAKPTAAAKAAPKANAAPSARPAQKSGSVYAKIEGDAKQYTIDAAKVAQRAKAAPAAKAAPKANKQQSIVTAQRVNMPVKSNPNEYDGSIYKQAAPQGNKAYPYEMSAEELTARPANEYKSIATQVDELKKSVGTSLAASDAEDRKNNYYGVDPTEQKSIWGKALAGMANADDPSKTGGAFAYTSSLKSNQYRAANNALTNAQRILEEARQGKDLGHFFGGAAKGFGQKLFDIDTWFAGQSVIDGLALKEAIDAYDKGQPLTDAQQKLLDAKALEAIVMQYYGDQLGRGYKAGQVTAQSIPFMLEMAINPMSKAGDVAVKKLTQYMIKRWGKNMAKSITGKVMRTTAKAAGDMAGSIGMTATSGLPRVEADALDRMNGQAAYDIDENGDVRYNGSIGRVDEKTALKKAFTNTTIENYSEMFGNYFGPIFGAVGKGASKVTGSKFGKAIGLDKVQDIISNARATDISQALSKVEKATKWNGTFGEYAEEVVGNVMNGLLVGDQTFDTNSETGIFNLNNNIDTFLGVGLMGGFFSTIRTAGYGIDRYQYNAALSNMSKDCDYMLGNRWEDVKRDIDSGDKDAMVSAIAGVLTDNGLSQDKKRAVLNYAKLKMQKDGSEAADEKKTEESEISANMKAGYEATPEEAKQIYEDYMANPSIENEEKINGVYRHIDDDANEWHVKASYELQHQVGSDGMLHPVTLIDKDSDGNNKQAFLINEDKENETCTIYDPETGKTSMIWSKEIESRGDAQSEDDAAKALIDQHKQMVKAAHVALGDMSDEENDGAAVAAADNGAAEEQAAAAPTEVPAENAPTAIAPTAAEETAINGADEEGFVEGAPEKYDAGMLVRVKREDGSGNVGEAVVNGYYNVVRSDNGRMEFVPDENGRYIGYNLDGETYHATVSDFNNMVDSYQPMQSAVPVEQQAVGYEANGEEAIGEQIEQPAVENAPQAEAAAEVPQGGAEDANAMPMTEKGEPDFLATTPERGHTYIYNESGLPANVASDLIANNIVAADKMLENAKKDEPKIGTSIAEYKQKHDAWQQTVDAAQQAVNYWNGVKAIDDAAAEAEAQAEAERKAAEEAAQAEAARIEAERKAKEEAELKAKEKEERKAASVENAEPVAEEDGIRVNRQGNPVDDDGNLILEKVESIDDITDEDFLNPKRNIELPALPRNIDEAIGANGKSVIIKKNIFEKNLSDHSDLSPEQGRDILRSALYDTNLYGQNRKASKPYNWIVVNIKGDKENKLVLIEVNNNKDNVEIIHWHFVRDVALETIKRQAEREGGRILMLPSINEEAGGLSSRTLSLSSERKDTNNSETSKENVEESSQAVDNEEQKNEEQAKNPSAKEVEEQPKEEEKNEAKGEGLKTKEEDDGEEIKSEGENEKAQFENDRMTDELNKIVGTVEGLSVDDSSSLLNHLEKNGEVVDPHLYIYHRDGKAFIRFTGKGHKKYADEHGYKYDRGNRDAAPSVEIEVDADNFAEKYEEVKEELGISTDVAKTAPIRKDGIMACGEYYGEGGLRELAHKVKDGDEKAIKEAARIMAPYIGRGKTLVPMPSHYGSASVTYKLCEDISKINGNRVESGLIGSSRESMYDAKKAGRTLSEEELGFMFIPHRIVDNKNAIIIDNVVASGTTARAAMNAVPGAKVMALAMDSKAYDNASEQRGDNETEALSDTKADSKETREEEANRINDDFSKHGVSWIKNVVGDNTLRAISLDGENIELEIYHTDEWIDNDDKKGNKFRFPLGCKHLSEMFGLKLTGEDGNEYGILTIPINGDMAKAVEKLLDVRDEFDKYRLAHRKSKEGVNEQRGDGDAKEVSEQEAAEREALADILRGTGSEAIGNAEEGQRVLDESNAKDSKKLMKAYHGSASIFEHFDSSHFLEGEGGMNYGAGHYVSSDLGTGMHFADLAVNRKYTADGSERQLYEVEIPDDNGKNYIPWEEKPSKEQLHMVGEALSNEQVCSLLIDLSWDDSEQVQTPDARFSERGWQKVLDKTMEFDPSQKGAIFEEWFGRYREGTGESLYNACDMFVNDKEYGKEDVAISKFLSDAGFTGIKVQTGAENGGNGLGMNYVVFKGSDLKINNRTKFFRTEEGEVYGFVKDGKIYYDPRIATKETMVHEYSHLWAAALRKANPEAWNRLKDEMKKDAELMDYVKGKYLELTDEDELMEEVFAHYSGKRGAERLNAEMREEMEKADGVFNKAKIASVFARLKDLLDRFWGMARDLFAGSVKGLDNVKAADFADMTLNDLLRGFNPNDGMESTEGNEKSEAEKRISEYVSSNNLSSDAFVEKAVAGAKSIFEREGVDIEPSMENIRKEAAKISNSIYLDRLEKKYYDKARKANKVIDSEEASEEEKANARREKLESQSNISSLRQERESRRNRAHFLSRYFNINENDAISDSDVADLFHLTVRDKGLNDLFDAVQDIIKGLGINYTTIPLDEDADGAFSNAGIISYRLESLVKSSATPEEIAHIILHEKIHAIATAVSYVMTGEAENDYTKRNATDDLKRKILNLIGSIGKEQAEAWNELNEIYQECLNDKEHFVKENGERTYAMNSVDEFISETFSNPAHIEELKSINKWERVKNAIFDLLGKFGLKESVGNTMYRRARRAFDKLMDNFSEEAYNLYKEIPVIKDYKSGEELSGREGEEASNEINNPFLQRKKASTMANAFKTFALDEMPPQIEEYIDNHPFFKSKVGDVETAYNYLMSINENEYRDLTSGRYYFRIPTQYELKIMSKEDAMDDIEMFIDHVKDKLIDKYLTSPKWLLENMPALVDCIKYTGIDHSEAIREFLGLDEEAGVFDNSVEFDEYKTTHLNSASQNQTEQSSINDKFDVIEGLKDITGAKSYGKNSAYAKGKTEDGESWVIRISNHAANETNFAENDEDADLILSIIVSDDFDRDSQKQDPLTNEDKGRWQFVVTPKEYAEDKEYIEHRIQLFMKHGLDPIISDVLFRDGEESPIFESNAAVAVAGIKQEKATPQQWLAMIQKAGGLKAGEDKWMGLSEWLKNSDRKSLTKDEVMQYIADNTIQVEEVEYGEGRKYDDEFMDVFHSLDNEAGYSKFIHPERHQDTDINSITPMDVVAINAYDTMADKYGKDFEDNYKTQVVAGDVKLLPKNGGGKIDVTRLMYTTDGLTNKREIALVVPTIEPFNANDPVHFGDAGNGRSVAWVRFGDAMDADGKKVLVIDEVQSKRHQDGRENGYGSKDDAYKKWKEASKRRLDSFKEHIGNINEYLNTEEYQELVRAEQEADDEWHRMMSSHAVPDAPFEKNWHELAMKRMLRYAAENGYDKVAWTTGGQQAERYGLGRVVKGIEIYPWEKPSDNGAIYDIESKAIRIDPYKGNPMYFDITRDGVILNEPEVGEQGQHISEVFGKELAADIMATEGRKSYEGAGLTFGGEGMKGFYDQMLPKFMDKYGKKWGVKTEDVTLDLPNEGDRVMHAVNVTPEMKESVMKGQPMFRLMGKGERNMSEDEFKEEYEAGRKTARGFGYSKKQYDEYLKKRDRQARYRFNELVETLKLQDKVEFLESNEGLSGRKKNAKGWYDTKTGKIVIVLGNHRNQDDVVMTILHESIGHYGLRKLFGKNFDTFLDEVYDTAEEGVRREIASMMAKHNWNVRVATEEYLAQLAERTDFESYENSTLWGRVKEAFLNMLTRAGLHLRDVKGLVGDNELRYILWRSYENLQHPGRYRDYTEIAMDTVMQDNLGVLRVAENNEIAAERVAAENGEHYWSREDEGDGDGGDDDPNGGVRFREGEDKTPRAAARDTYERMMQSSTVQAQEALQDSMMSLKKLYEAVLGEGKDVKDVSYYENAYTDENAMSSKNNAQIHVFEKDFVEPITKAVYKLTKGNGEAYNELTDYMMAKHGLERNEVLARRDAAKMTEDKYGDEFRAAKKAADADPLDQELQDKLAEVSTLMREYQDEQYNELRGKDYAGLTALTGMDNVADAEAAASEMVAAYEAAHETQRLWDAVNAATNESLYKMYVSGMMSTQRYQDIRGMFEYYIPLQGFDEKVAEEEYAYLGSDGTLGYGTPIRTAKGRKSKADDPIATIAMNGEAAIRQGNRNVMKQKFLNFVESHPSDLVSVQDVWLRKNDVTGEWEQYFDADLKENDTPDEIAGKVADFEEKMEKLRNEHPEQYKKSREMPNVPFRVVEAKDMKQHQVMVKRNGKSYMLIVNGNPRAAQALNGLTNPNVNTDTLFGKLLNGVQSVNGWLSRVYTTMNPEFMVSNYIRDAIYSNSMAWVKEKGEYAKKFNVNFGKMNPVFMNKMYAEWNSGKLREKVRQMQFKTDLSEMDQLRQYFYEFMMNGGQTGWNTLRDIEKHKQDLQKALKREGSMTRKAIKALGTAFDIMNNSVENNARFAAYITSRQSGRTIGRSIYDAKEISVNFNKKGAGDKFMSSNGQTKFGRSAAFASGFGRQMYVFWNASVQGINNVCKAAKQNPAKFYPAATALFSLGAVAPIMAHLIGGGDDDDYYNLPEYVRRSNICFRFGSDMPWITLPLPVEYRAVYGMGELATGTLTGKERYSNTELAKQMASQVSQVMPIDMLEGGGGWNAFVPSVVKPVVEAETNKSWSGLPIYRDDTFKKYDPKWTLAYKGANKQLVGAAKFINEATGGNDAKQGAIDINPAAIEYLMNGYLGGLFTIPNKVSKTTSALFGDQEKDWKNVPLVSRVLKNGDERTEERKTTNRYFDLKDEYEETRNSVRGYEAIIKDAMEDAPKYQELLNSLKNDDEYKHYEVMKYLSPIVEKYYDMEKEVKSDTKKKHIEDEEKAMRSLCVEMVDRIDNGSLRDVRGEIDNVLLGIAQDESAEVEVRKTAQNKLKALRKEEALEQTK